MRKLGQVGKESNRREAPPQRLADQPSAETGKGMKEAEKFKRAALVVICKIDAVISGMPRGS